MPTRNRMDENEMPYKPGSIITTGNKTYQADCFGVLIPQAQNKAYLRRKAKMLAALKEDAKRN